MLWIKYRRINKNELCKIYIDCILLESIISNILLMLKWIINSYVLERFKQNIWACFSSKTISNVWLCVIASFSGTISLDVCYCAIQFYILKQLYKRLPDTEIRVICCHSVELRVCDIFYVISLWIIVIFFCDKPC